MTDNEFILLSDKLDDVRNVCQETKGIVAGHGDRLETCEKDRDDLFTSRNTHETRLTKIETSRKERSSNKGEDRRLKTSRFDWTLRIIIAFFTCASTIILAFRVFG